MKDGMQDAFSAWLIFCYRTSIKLSLYEREIKIIYKKEWALLLACQYILILYSAWLNIIWKFALYYAFVRT